MLLISGFMNLWKIYCISSVVRVINCCRFHIFRCSASSFSFQYLLLKSYTSSILLLLPIPFTSVIYPSIASWKRQFLLRIWSIREPLWMRHLNLCVICPVHMAFVCNILFRTFYWNLLELKTFSACWCVLSWEKKKRIKLINCCSKNHGLQLKKWHASVAVPPLLSGLLANGHLLKVTFVG